MVSSGCKELDMFIGDGFLDSAINLIYGVPASGKTTLAIHASVEQAKQGKKVLFFDTENGFSIERLKQISGDNYKVSLENIFVIKIKDFEDQIKTLRKFIKKSEKNPFSLIVMDSLAKYYRLSLKEEIHTIVNARMAKMISDINHFARENNLCVLFTNQVYADQKDGNIKMVGGDMVKNWCKLIIELKKNGGRFVAFNDKLFSFEINEKGVTPIEAH